MKYFIKKIIKDESGQSLVEILVALTIGALLIGAASTAVVTVLQSGTTSQRHQSATILSQDYLEKIRAYASSDWHNVYNLSKGPDNLYHFEASSTDIIAVKGQEGVIDNDIRGNLAGYWSLDEASSTVSHDKSGNGNNGEINGATATSTDCRVGRCYSFDGSNDYINVSHDSTLNFGNDSFSVVAWFYDDPSSGQTDWRNIVSKKGGGGTAAGWTLRLDTDDDLNFFTADGSSTNFGDAGQVSQGEWHHAVGVVDKDEGRKYVYLNGNLVASSSNVGNVDTNSDLRIGSWAAGTDFWWGHIDDVRVYNKALSEDDIDHLHNSATFTRHFYVEDVCRTNDADYEVAGVKPCDPGEKEDPSTQKITVVVEWGDTGEFILDDYVTRWRNRVFPQEDWSGGAGFEGPVTEPTDRYSTSTDISTSTEGLQIEGI